MDRKSKVARDIAAWDMGPIKKKYLDPYKPKFGEWQDIATAPRDGTRILTVHDETVLRISSWVEDNGLNAPGYWSPAYRSTHWMPLPDPPP